MTAPATHPVLLQPPHVGMHNDVKIAYNFNYEIWKRTGGYNSSTVDLKGLTASVDEINTLVGVNTDDSVQQQIDLKANSDDLGTIASQDAENVAITGGTVTAVTVTNSNITIPVGLTTNLIPIGGTLTVDTTSVGTVGAGEDTLITYTIDTNTLNLDGNYLEISAWGTVAANANNKTIKLKLGTTTLLTTGAVAANTGSWFITAKIIRTGAATQQGIASIISDNALIVDSSTFTAATENLASSLDLFCTGEGTNDDDIVQQGLIIKWFK